MYGGVDTRTGTKLVKAFVIRLETRGDVVTGNYKPASSLRL